MERELDASIALNPIPNALVWKGRAAFALRGDLPAMKTWLDRIPGRTHTSGRAVFSTFIWASLSGQADAGLEALNSYPEAWFSDPEFVGPAALLRASLLELQGKRALAQLQAQAALVEVHRRIAADPASADLRIAETWALCGLGRLEEARVANRV
jgi:hypothetical protein